MPDSIAPCAISNRRPAARLEATALEFITRAFRAKVSGRDADLNFLSEIYFHKLGTADTEDTYSIRAKDFPRIAEVKLEAIATENLFSPP